MSTRTGIEWTDATWNPVVGCAPVSPGCDRCYAAGDAGTRLAHHPLYEGLTRRTEDGRREFNGLVRLAPHRLRQPLGWTKPQRIFVNSMADLFHDGVPDEYIAKVMAIMIAAPHHRFQVLTKRHARMRSLTSSPAFWLMVSEVLAELWRLPAHDPVVAPLRSVPSWIWMGVSVEDQKWADIRLPALAATPAHTRWVSAEPLLGPVDLTRYLWMCATTEQGPWSDHTGQYRRLDGRGEHPIRAARVRSNYLHWVVVGGETRSGARPMRPEWARELRDQCEAAGVPFLFKQWGDNGWPDQMSDDAVQRLDAAVNLGSAPGPDHPYRVGKKAAGRLLDGTRWDQYPIEPKYAAVRW